MARYKEADVYAFLNQHGCEYEGDRYATGQAWFTRDGHPFTIPDPVNGYFDADVIDAIVADRWLGTGPVPLTRYP